MKKNDYVKLLLPGIIVGFILGLILSSLVGVNKEKEIVNFIGGGMCCAVPTLLNCLIVLKGASKVLKRKLSIIKALKQALPYIILAFVFGFLFVAVLVTRVLNINTCELSVLVTAIYQAILGVIISSLSAYLAVKDYEKKVKYTKRK